MKREFFQSGKEVQIEPLHYTMCGLEDIYLLNGFQRRQTDYGDGVTVNAIDGLHRAIGLSLVSDRKTLSPKELRFLRKLMDKTQEQLGQALRLSGQQIARWEKGECPISGPAEALLRILFVMEMLPAKHRATFINAFFARIDQLAKTDETKTQKLAFKETASGWIKLPQAGLEMVFA